MVIVAGVVDQFGAARYTAIFFIGHSNKVYCLLYKVLYTDRLMIM
jgi:hypothetical protein